MRRLLLSFRTSTADRNLLFAGAHEFFSEIRFYNPLAVLVFQSIAGSFALAMSVFSVRSVAQALLEVPTGVFSDRVGRRMTLIWGAVANLMGTLCFALAFFVPHGLLCLYAGAAFLGLANALHSGNNDSMIYESLVDERRGKETPHALGRLMAMEQVGLAISGLFAMALVAVGMGYRELVLLSPLAAIVGLLCCFFTREPTRHRVEEEHSLKHILHAVRLIRKDPRLLMLAGATSFTTALGNCRYYFAPAFIASVWPLWLTPVYRTLQNGAGFISLWISGSIVSRFGALRTLVWGTTVSNFLGLVAYVLSNFISPLLLMVVQFFFGGCRTANSTLQQEAFADSTRATMGSVISFATTLLTAVFATAMGWLVDMTSPAFGLGLSIVVGLPSIWMYYNLYRGKRREVKVS